MKLLILSLLVVLVLSGCAQGPQGTTTGTGTSGVTNADIQELENLETEINSDLEEIDSLLQEFDATSFEEIDLGLDEVQ